MFETIKSSFINFVESAKLHNIDVVQPEPESDNIIAISGLLFTLFGRRAVYGRVVSTWAERMYML
jgi:hypothetical protein